MASSSSLVSVVVVVVAAAAADQQRPNFFFAVLEDICKGVAEAACELAVVVCVLSGVFVGTPKRKRRLQSASAALRR